MILFNFNNKSLYFNLCILYTFLSLLNCKKDTTIRVDEVEKEHGSTITIKNFQRTAIDSKGNLLWKLNAEETYYFKKNDKSILYNIEVEQFENGKIKAKIKADKGEILKKENIIKAFGNIYMKSTDGKILEAEEISMNTETNILSSDKKVLIKSSGTVVRGVGLIADNSLNKYKILKPEGITSGGSNPLEK